MIDYTEALARQQVEVARVQAGGADQLIFCSHPAVVTCGRGTQVGDVSESCAFPQVEVDRGGRATYHGPEQFIIYPIFNLNRPGYVGSRARDVVDFLRRCEARTIAVLQTYLVSHAIGIRKGETGVWVGLDANSLSAKIASVGIAVRAGVTSHGIALNCEISTTAFQGIKPCGFDSQIMTSVEHQLGRKVPREELVSKFTRLF